MLYRNFKRWQELCGYLPLLRGKKTYSKACKILFAGHLITELNYLNISFWNYGNFYHYGYTFDDKIQVSLRISIFVATGFYADFFFKS
jgi:hypothetical protein